jgi:pyruvate dehydrogenase E2 component (dihydrolipoamide acetyltransferase)
MTIEFKLPELGENIEAGEVVNVLVSAGDTVEQDQPVLELETDKATIEVPSSMSGTIEEVLVQSGQTVNVGQVVFTVAGPAEEKAEEPEPEAEAEPEQPEPEAAEAKPAAQEKPAPSGGGEAKRVVEFKLPEVGENIEQGDVVAVLVSVGDQVEADQPVLELETDKATIEIPVTVGGVVKEIHVSQGEQAAVGQVVLTIETTDAAKSTPAEAPPEPVEQKEEPPAQAAPEKGAAPEAEEWPVQHEISDKVSPDLARSHVPAAPNLRRLAREIGVDIARVEGTGPGGRITMDDVKKAARERAAGPAAPTQVQETSLPDFSQWGQVEREPMSNVRRATAEHVSGAWNSIPHVTQFDRADIQELEQLRKRFGPKVEEAGGKLTVTAILVKVLAAALKAFPKFNASLDMVNQEIIYKQYYHIGIAVDTERGLLVPVIRDVDRKNILELSVELTEVAEKARNRKLALEDMQGGCMSITNLGGIGGTNFTPIVNAPEVAILGVARGRVEPVYRDGQFEPRLMLPLALSYDHRLIDGADAARFLRWIVQALEDPVSMSLQVW